MSGGHCESKLQEETIYKSNNCIVAFVGINGRTLQTPKACVSKTARRDLFDTT